MTDSVVESNRLARTMLNMGIEAAKVNINYAKKNSSKIAEYTSDTARSYVQAIAGYPSDNDIAQGKTEDQILKKYPSATFPSNVVLGDVKPLRVIIKSDKPESIRNPLISEAQGEILSSAFTCIENNYWMALTEITIFAANVLLFDVCYFCSEFKVEKLSINDIISLS